MGGGRSREAASGFPDAQAARGFAGAPAPGTADLWQLGKSRQAVHRFSTLFTAQNVRDHLSTDEGLEAALDWCRKTAVTKVYVETFRDGYQAERAALLHARDRFRAAGMEVSGCVTTTRIGVGL